MNQKVKIIIQFDGHGFYGWQIQNQTSPTIQELVNKALAAIYKEPVATIGSGRTDTGVHSLQHHVVFVPPFAIDNDKIIRALNSHLPSSIRVIDCELVTESFRPTNDAIKKQYRYIFSNEIIQTPFLRHYMSNISYSLDFNLMQQACAQFEGDHDFKSFMCTGSDPSSTVRTIFSCEISQEHSCFQGIIPKHYVITVSGNGFLKQMVRLMVGTVWNVGRGKIGLNDLELELSEPSGKHLAPVAPAQGLFKFSVDY